MSRFDPRADEPQDPFIEQLSALLARTAESAPRPNPNLARQVRQRLSVGGQPSRAHRSFVVRHPALASIGTIAVVALLLVAFAALLVSRGVDHLGFGGATSATRTPTPPSAATPACMTSPGASHAPPRDPNPPLRPNPVDHSITVNQSATDSGVTVTIERAYADATQTVVTFRFSPDSGYSVLSPVLADTAGARYGWLTGGSSLLPNHHYENALIFAPLPQRALGTPQRLTLTLIDLANASGGAEGAQPTTLKGRWTIPFTITPVAGTAIPLSLPAQTHDGVTVQLDEMDIAPAGGGLDGQSGGVRVRYRVSGLPATMPLSDVSQYPTAYAYTDGSPVSGSGSGASASAPGGAACHNLLTLTLSDGLQLIPGFILPVGAYVPDFTSSQTNRAIQTVGASGSVEVQAIFFAPIPSGNATLTTNLISLSELRDGKLAHLRNAQGPWVLTAPVK